MNTPLSPVSGRLASLDILRGFDLFLLVFFQPVFVALGQRLNFPWLNDILYQFDRVLDWFPVLGPCDATFPVYDRSLHAFFLFQV